MSACCLLAKFGCDYCFRILYREIFRVEEVLPNLCNQEFSWRKECSKWEDITVEKCGNDALGGRTSGQSVKGGNEVHTPRMVRVQCDCVRKGYKMD